MEDKMFAAEINEEIQTLDPFIYIFLIFIAGRSLRVS
jgi:hypothetical protein